MAILLLSSISPIVASKRRPSRRKPKRVTFPRLLKRAFTSLASSPLISYLPPPLDLLPPLISAPRRRVRSSRGQSLLVLLSAASGSLLGLNAKEIAKIRLRVVLPEMRSAAAGYFFLGFLVCFLICQAFVFARRRRSGWKF